MRSMSIVGEKVARITGGASGMGISFAKELLRNGLKGVALVDINTNNGYKALKNIEKEFGKDRAFFVQADVSDKKQVEDAFKRTVEKFKQLDIVINNAGILNEEAWEKEISINCNGTVCGTLLAVEEYLPKYKSDEEGVVVNIASVAGLNAISYVPLYSATKHFNVAFSTEMGNNRHYFRTKVRVLALCPGPTLTGMGFPYPKIYKTNWLACISMWNDLAVAQRAKHVAKGLLTVLNEGKSGSVWVVEQNKPAYQVDLSNRFQRPSNTYD